MKMQIFWQASTRCSPLKQSPQSGFIPKVNGQNGKSISGDQIRAAEMVALIFRFDSFKELSAFIILLAWRLK